MVLECSRRFASRCLAAYLCTCRLYEHALFVHQHVQLIPQLIQRNMLFFLLFPLCRGEAGLLVTAKYGYFRDLLPSVPVVGIFSPLSSSSAFLRYLFTQCSHLNCGLPRFWNLLASLSRLFSVVYHLSFVPCVQPISPGS